MTALLTAVPSTWGSTPATVLLVIAAVCGVGIVIDVFVHRRRPQPAFERKTKECGDERGTTTDWVETRRGTDANVTPEPLRLKVDIPPTVPVITDERVYCEKSAGEIWALYDGRTELQGSEFVKQYREQWIRQPGTVVNVAESQMTIRADESSRTIVMFFDPEWRERLLTVSAGARVIGEGQMQKITGNVIYLRHSQFDAE